MEIRAITWEAFEDFAKHQSPWPSIFVRPFWLKTVVRRLGAPGEPLLLMGLNGAQPVGIAPLALKETTAYFLGDPAVCDYQDLISLPGREAELLTAVVDELTRRGVRRLVLRALRPTAAALVAARSVAAARHLPLALDPDNVSYEVILPDDWESYLAQLDGKRRHEIRRKLRRLENAGPFNFYLAQPAGPAMATFLRLFGSNRADKAAFMTPAMTAYFEELTAALESHGLLRLYFLEVCGAPAAAVLCFDDQGVRYLYNSAYDARFEELSVGLLCKVLSIRKAIDLGCRCYDLLKGAEAYKRRIGGVEVPLQQCILSLDHSAS